jgi:hypothetical protein
MYIFLLTMRNLSLLSSMVFSCSASKHEVGLIYSKWFCSGYEITFELV